MRLNILIITAITLLSISCSDETYVEGLIPKTYISDINQTINFQPSDAAINLQIGNEEKKLTFRREKYKLGNLSYTPYLLANPQDSIMKISVYTLGFTTLFPAANANSTNTLYIDNYTNNEVINPAQFVTTSSNGQAMIIAVKKSPYTGNWEGINSYSQGTSQLLTLDWLPKTKGYLGFSTKSSTNTTSNNEEFYGWLEITFNEKNIILHRIGYQNLNKIKAGN